MVLGESKMANTLPDFFCLINDQKECSKTVLKLMENDQDNKLVRIETKILHL